MSLIIYGIQVPLLLIQLALLDCPFCVTLVVGTLMAASWSLSVLWLLPLLLIMAISCGKHFSTAPCGQFACHNWLLRMQSKCWNLAHPNSKLANQTTEDKTKAHTSFLQRNCLHFKQFVSISLHCFVLFPYPQIY